MKKSKITDVLPADAYPCNHKDRSTGSMAASMVASSSLSMLVALFLVACGSDVTVQNEKITASPSVGGCMQIAEKYITQPIYDAIWVTQAGHPIFEDDGFCQIYTGSSHLEGVMICAWDDCLDGALTDYTNAGARCMWDNETHRQCPSDFASAYCQNKSIGPPDESNGCLDASTLGKAEHRSWRFENGLD